MTIRIGAVHSPRGPRLTIHWYTQVHGFANPVKPCLELRSIIVDKIQPIGSEDSVETLLQRYYKASPPETDALETALLDRVGRAVRRWLRCTCFQHDDILEKHAEVNYRLLVALRRGREPGARRIESFFGLARTTVSHIGADALRRDNPWYALRMRVYYLTTDERYTQRFGRWTIDPDTLIGLYSQFGEKMLYTETYREFCFGDDRFVQVAMQGRHPANLEAVRLPDLLEKLLGWIETPLVERLLIDHLAALRGLVMTSVESLEDAAIRQERPADEIIAAPEPPREDQDWDACLQEIRFLTLNNRRVLLYSLSAQQLRMLMGQVNPAALVAELVEFPLSHVQELLPLLPLDDDRLAAQLETTKSNVHAIRSRVRAYLRKKLCGTA